ncbi:hypothetical protein GALMADRAFT_1139389 [Galerina marginata CBS 339.88]|uniref:Uncharacterized protein n=1 Tax=Galerina marginata (strain CBS 339.88) TaxID=685588 RepID=A0A067SIY7_GALM3|nr:hypothetical protein GALMADRAFT_1139389 [Galerina marginata CBS 339.88]
MMHDEQVKFDGCSLQLPVKVVSSSFSSFSSSSPVFFHPSRHSSVLLRLLFFSLTPFLTFLACIPPSRSSAYHTFYSPLLISRPEFSLLPSLYACILPLFRHLLPLSLRPLFSSPHLASPHIPIFNQHLVLFSSSYPLRFSFLSCPFDFQLLLPHLPSSCTFRILSHHDGRPCSAKTNHCNS